MSKAEYKSLTFRCMKYIMIVKYISLLVARKTLSNLSKLYPTVGCV